MLDVVVTWVNGDTHRFGAQLASALEAERRSTGALPHPRAYQRNRFRPTICLRYALRSIRRYGVGLGRIFIITNGEFPEWLDGGAAGINFVSHEEFIPNENLPTFNSNAIELCISRIPGLGERFIYFNDDVFLTDEFNFANGGDAATGPLFHLEPWPMLRDLEDSNPVGGSAAYNAQLLDRRFFPRPIRYEVPHEPVIFEQAKLRALEATWPQEIGECRARKFRSARDFVLPRMYIHYLLETAEEVARAGGAPQPHILPSQSQFIGYGGTEEDLRRQIDRVSQTRAPFLCVNDEAGERTDAGQEGALNEAILEAYLATLFPEPAPWERDR